MGKFRFWIAMIMAKISVIALKVTRHNGTNFPGELALKICPGFMKYIGTPERVIGVTGTNGKTTTCNMVLDALIMAGEDPANNKAGSNIDSGIATALIRNAKISGKCRKSIGVFEIDERSTRKIFPYLTPDYLVITNLSRDSIMRNAHPEYISSILTKYIPERTKLLLNADDLIASGVAPDNERVYFGIEKMDGDIKECINLINDLQICPKCHSKLRYEYLRYSHIGRAYCPQCGFKAPEYDYRARNVDTQAMTLEVESDKGTATYRLPNDSVYNIYNVVAAISLLLEIGYSTAQIQDFMEKTDIVGSRYDEIKTENSTIYLLLAKDKNAFGTTRTFDYVAGREGDKEIIIMNSCLSDVVNWSENVCWMYDCDFEFLNKDDIKNIVVCGPRARDYRLRLLMADIPEEKVSYTDKEMDAPDKLKDAARNDVYVLYGTESIRLGYDVARKVEQKAKEGGENA